jgi:virginiamycin B lyase
MLASLLLLPAVSAQANNSVYVEEFSVPKPYLGPLAITYHEGNIWFTLDGSNAIGTFDPSDKSFKIYNLPWQPTNQVTQYGMEGIAIDKDGMVWFTHSSTSRIGRFNPQSQIFSGIVVRPNASTFKILPDKAGNIWYSDIQNNKIGFVSPEGAAKEFDLPTTKSGPAGLFFDSSGKLWFTETFAKKVGVVDLQTSSITEFPAPRDFINSPVGIVVDNNGIVWVADHGGAAIVRFDPKSNTWNKFITSRPPPDLYPISLPNDLSLDKQGNIWVTEHGGNKIAKFDSKTNLLTEYVIPSVPAITLWLTIDDAENVWFAEAEADKIGKLDTKKPVPFTISLSADTVSVSAGKESVFSAKVESSQNIPKISMLSYGFPTALNVTTKTKELLVQSAGSQIVDFLVNIRHEIDQGKYGYAISASDGKVIQTRTITVNVEAPRSNQDLILYASVGIASATIAAIVVFLLIFRRVWKS